MRRSLLFTLLALPAATACGAQTAPAPAATPTPMTKVQYLAECGGRLKRQGIEAKFIASSCASEFETVTATLPLARTILKLAQTPPAQLQTQAQLKAVMPTLVWTKALKPEPPITVSFQGQYTKDLAFGASGAGKVEEIGWQWSEQTATLPYDVPGALRFLGAKVTAFACGSGGGTYGDEKQTEYRVEIPGAPPLHLSIGGRDAAMGGEWGFWGISIKPSAPVPSAAAFIAKPKPEDDSTSWGPCPR